MTQGEATIARLVRRQLLSEDAAAKELRQGQEDRSSLDHERANLLGQLEAASHWQNLDTERLCQQARASLEAATPDIRRLAFEALGVKATCGKGQATVSLSLPLDTEPEGSFVLPSPRGS